MNEPEIKELELMAGSGHDCKKKTCSKTAAYNLKLNGFQVQTCSEHKEDAKQKIKEAAQQ